MDKHEASQILSRNLEFIKQADAKAGFVATILFIVIGYLTSKSYLFTDKVYTTIVLVGLMLLAGIDLLFLVKSVYPKINDTHTATSHIYYGSVAKLTIRKYSREALRLGSQALLHEYLDQIYVTSVIVNRKMKNIKVAMGVLIILTVLTAASILIARAT